ncbi:high light inducible protein [Oscillatoriales cyanobacterium USR001]|nr:high light inducible protein [Oscillatoriales cyanobacterium USR001]
MNSNGAQLDNQAKHNDFTTQSNAYAIEEARTGFTPYAERLNGRLAMIGFILLLGLQVLVKHGFFG